MASATSIPTNFTRRAGSGWTIFTFAGQPIAFCQQVQTVSPMPVGQGVSAIQPMDEPYPVEILTPAAAGMGTITLNLIELFGTNGYASKVWDRLGIGANASGAAPFGPQGIGDTSQFLNIDTNFTPQQSGGGIFTGAVDIVDIFIRQAQADPSKLQIVEIIRPPSNPNGQSKPYYLQYVGCVITNVQDGEEIDVGTLEVLKNITVAYRYVLRDGVPSAAFNNRDAMLGHGGTIGR